MPTVSSKYPSDNGRKDFQPICINWSYLYLGNAALVKIKNITPITILRESQKLPGRTVTGKLCIIGNQPPKNNIDEKALIKSIFAYSPKKKRANVIAEYSTLYPETSSASASGKSKGCLLVSANIEI